MKVARPVADVIREVIRQNEAKSDYVASSHAIEMTEGADGVFMSIGDDRKQFGLGEIAHDHLSNITEIPRRFYDRLRGEASELLAHNVNTLLQKREEKPQLLRELDGSVRAVLSSGYQIRDNFDAITTILPVLNDTKGDAIIRSMEITDQKLYLQIASPKVRGEIVKGDVVTAGFQFTNSEVGLGRTEFHAWIERLVCLNGMKLPESLADLSFARTHLGARRSEFGKLEALVSDDSRRLQEQAFWASLKDVIMGLLKGDFLQNAIGALQQSAQKQITGVPVKSVEVLQKKLQLTEGEKDRVIEHLLGDLNGGGLNQYGMINALTRTAQDVDSYDRAVSLEAMAGNLLVMPARDWHEVAVAA